jgi:glycerophosphoryl diester phosphodiesterase
MCGVLGTIHERTLAELRTLSCHQPGTFGERFRGEGLACLAAFVQLLRKHPDVHAFVEIKRVAIERLGNEKVLEKILHAIEPAYHQCTLISFSIPFLAATRRVHEIPLGVVFDRWKEREQAAIWELAPEYVFCDVEGLPARGLLKHERACTVVYEVADPAQALALGERGVELVETFEIGAMRKALNGQASAQETG